MVAIVADLGNRLTRDGPERHQYCVGPVGQGIDTARVLVGRIGTGG